MTMTALSLEALPQSAPRISVLDDKKLQRPPRLWFNRTSTVMEMPYLISTQVDSFKWFQREGLRELLDEISPITDFTGKSMELHFLDYHFDKPRYSPDECRDRDATFAAPLKVNVRLVIKETGEVKDSEIFMGDFHMMTDTGTYVVNGAERVVVSQLVRSPGILFIRTDDPVTGHSLFGAKLIPNRGAWLEFETSNKNVISVKVDRKRKIPVTVLLRSILAVLADDGVKPSEVGHDEHLIEMFAEANATAYTANSSGGEGAPRFNNQLLIQQTIEKDPTKNGEEALIELYKRLRPGDPPNIENARNLLFSLLFNPRRYDLARVGRYKLNKRLKLDVRPDLRHLTKDDIFKIVAMIIRLNNGEGHADDIDHLGNRRIRAVGELIQSQLRVGLLRMERVIKERMSITDPTTATPNSLVNIRPVVAAMREFFGGSQLSQFMDQNNPLAELTHKRRLSALGPGGLNRDRAGFEVRDVHHSHYGRICPIETPEGPNIGLIGNLATYARVNEYGFIETPYRKVVHRVDAVAEQLEGKILRETIADPNTGEVIAEEGVQISLELSEKIGSLGLRTVRIQPVVIAQIDYLSADREEEYRIAQANVELDDDGHFVQPRVAARYGDEFVMETPDLIDYMDVSPKQVVSVATALIPFLEHDDANRALMGANMQRQAVPLLRPQSPVVGTGVEWQAARDSGRVMLSQADGVVSSSTGESITVTDDNGEEYVHKLTKFVRSNQDTCINQRPSINKGERVAKGQVVADNSSTEKGELALGQNVLVAFMPWEGGNFEDAILVSEELVHEDTFTSIHIEKYETEARDTKLGPEEITRDIPNVGEESLRDLDERGIIYVGADVQPNDILVGKITPKGETELTAEERLLRAIFGEKAREVKDTSLRVPNGVRGKVIDVKIFSRENNDELPAGVNQMVRVSLAQKRKISAGDKMAGRHGNKGVISRVLPIEDMPFLPDGRPIQIILNPIGVPSRMNLGQLLETHLGWAAKRLGVKIATPVFDGVHEEEIHKMLEMAGLPADGKIQLFDGRTGEPFDQPVMVGIMYYLKLAHLVEDKIHARSTGPYSLVTQQPLGGKAQFGGQRFGEMEVWALEAYGAAHILQEMITVKSDDVIGRVKTYEAIVKGEEILEAGVPESFKVLVKELQSLGLNIEVLNEEEAPIEFAEDTGGDYLSELEGINLSGFENSGGE
ncbi:MAG: DNA-directed RNA polymerase subunit beta [Chloroflexi bacterium]|uniref:DNA-directed RNA polymerase subunit beta n=1 Tax=Candidatus Chlorohelix allophototropha TaxID=3003348 RepID=A0A8T7M986_9CHLR|nr:DNA-directed RNA polymerase subunit beta [Chloroflexota bacterium]WJW68647.1 DNA-directed RNA polymerase subunit beta [Chloroflexota bacterium L227-S17]